MDLQKKWKKFRSMGVVIALQKLIGYEAVFTCAYRKKGRDMLWEEGGTEEAFKVMDKSRDFWFADPLVVEYQSKTVLFMEAFERKTGIGRIACASVDDGKIGTPHVIIKESFHLSFPMIFEWNHVLYMMPETSTAKKQVLYRCAEFPYRWEMAAEILDGRQLVDIVVISQNEKEILFLGSECSKDNDLLSRFVIFSLYQDNDKFCTCLKEEFNKTQKFEWDSRNAGYPIQDGKKRIFPFQRSTEAIYGYSLRFYKGTEDELPYMKKNYREIFPSSIELEKKYFKRAIGIHTYSSTKEYEIIDVQYMEYNKRKWIERWKKRH